MFNKNVLPDYIFIFNDKRNTISLQWSQNERQMKQCYAVAVTILVQTSRTSLFAGEQVESIDFSLDEQRNYS